MGPEENQIIGKLLILETKEMFSLLNELWPMKYSVNDLSLDQKIFIFSPKIDFFLAFFHQFYYVVFV